VASRGAAWQVEVLQGRCGEARLVRSRYGKVRQVGQGALCSGMVRQGR